MENNKKKLFESISKERGPFENFVGDCIPLDIISQEIKKTVELAKEPNLGIKVIDSGDLKLSPFYKIVILALGATLNTIFKPNLPEFFSYHQVEGAMLTVTPLIAHLQNDWSDQKQLLNYEEIFK